MFLKRVGAMVAVAGLLGAACGEDPPAVGFDDTTVAAVTTTGATVRPSSTTEAPATSVASVAAGEQWVDATANLIGLESECRTLSFMSARPDRDEVLAGVAGQGLWKNDPDSADWEPIGRGPASARIDNRTTSIVYDPSDPTTFWQTGILRSGVFRTNDDGTTFVRLGAAPPADLVSVDFSDPQRRTLLLGPHQQPRVFRSADGGATWNDVSAGLPPGVGFASSPLVLDSQTHLVGSRQGASSGVFRTTDGGVTWTRVFEGGVSGPPLVSKDGSIVWVLDRGGGVIASDDGGATWATLAGRGPVGGEVGRIIEVPDGTWVSMSTDNVVVSRDKGASWQAVGPPIPLAPNGFTYSPIRSAFYVWKFTCDKSTTVNPVLPGSIYRLDLDLSP